PSCCPVARPVQPTWAAFMLPCGEACPADLGSLHAALWRGLSSRPGQPSCCPVARPVQPTWAAFMLPCGEACPADLGSLHAALWRGLSSRPGQHEGCPYTHANDHSQEGPYAWIF